MYLTCLFVHAHLVTTHKKRLLSQLIRFYSVILELLLHLYILGPATGRQQLLRY
jgi:hypothetical protein